MIPLSQNGSKQHIRNWVSSCSPNKCGSETTVQRRPFGGQFKLVYEFQCEKRSGHNGRTTDCVTLSACSQTIKFSLIIH